MSNCSKGQALVEMMVGMGLAAAIMPALTTAFFAARGGTAQEQVRMQAIARLREGREVLRLIKESNWGNVSTNGTYQLVNGVGMWSLSAGLETGLDNQFTRQVVLGDVYRTPSGSLSTISLGNSLDPSVKHAVITVSWSLPIASSVVADYYLMRLENLPWLQTSLSDFGQGTQLGTSLTNISGGEVVLGSGGAGLSDWCLPALTLSAIDLPKSGVANAISAAVGAGTSANQIVAGTGENASGISLGYVTVSNTTPPVGSLQGTFDGYKTNNVFVAGTRAFISTDNSQEDVVIIDLSSRDPVTGKYSKQGAVNLPSNGPNNASTIYVSGSLGFVTIGNKLHTFDITTGTLIGSLTLSGNSLKMVVSGNYLFVAESTGDRALEIVQFSPDGQALTIPGFFSVVGQNGVDIVINTSSSRGYLATSQGKVYILNTMTPYSGSLPGAIGVYDTNGMTPTGVAIVTNNKAIVVGTGGTQQYQVVDITTENSLSQCGGLTVESGIRGIASVQEEDGDTFSYILTGDASAELKIIQGGGGGGGGTYAGSGIFESSIFDASHSAMFNRFDVTAVAPPPDTQIKYQVALTNPVAGSCTGASYAFVGPDKTSGTYFTSSAQLPLGTSPGYANPGQCLRYRSYLTTANTNNTPILYDITFNYSP